MKILQLIFTGLFTDPAGPSPDAAADSTKDCGMLQTAEAIRSKYPQHFHQINAFSWDGNGNPDANCQAILATITAMKPDRIIIHAHSFGNDLLIFFINWLARWYPHLGITIDLALGYDPCQNPFFGDTGWKINPSVVKKWHTWEQLNGKPWGVKGGGFYDPAGGNNTDVSDLGDGHVTQDGYLGVPNDDRIRAQVYVLVDTAITGVVTDG